MSTDVSKAPTLYSDEGYKSSLRSRTVCQCTLLQSRLILFIVLQKHVRFSLYSKCGLESKMRLGAGVQERDGWKDHATFAIFLGKCLCEWKEDASTLKMQISVRGFLKFIFRILITSLFHFVRGSLGKTSKT